MGVRQKVYRSGNRRAGAAKTAECVPQHLQDNRKYQRYSLADVDTSDRANTAAALSFLRSHGGGTKQSDRTNHGASMADAQRILGSGSGVVKFRPRKKQTGFVEQPVHPSKRRRVGQLLEEVVVGQPASAGASRRQAHGKTGRERAIAAGLLQANENGGTGASGDAQVAVGSGEAEQAAADRKATQRKKTVGRRKPAVALSHLSHLHEDESDD